MPGPLCQRCGATNAPGAQFCANCGNGLAAAPPPPPISPARPAFGMGGGAQGNATLAMDAGQVYTAALQALSAAGCEITGQQPGQAIQFVVTKKDLWNTGGMKVRYTGDVRFSQGQPRQTQARVALKVDWGGSMGIVAMCVVCAAMFFAILPLILAGYTIYTVGSVWPKKLAEELAGQLQMAAPGAAAPAEAPRSFSPPVQSAPVVEASLTPHEQLRKLKELLDLGALTQAEFDAKKTDILARF